MSSLFEDEEVQPPEYFEKDFKKKVESWIFSIDSEQAKAVLEALKESYHAKHLEF